MSSSIRAVSFGFFTVCTTGIIAFSPISFAHAKSQSSFIQSYEHKSNIKSEHIPLIYRAEKNTSRAGKAVLREARIMALEQQKIIRGSCWDYLNAVFNKARVDRKKIFTAKKDGGRYFKLNNLQSGDWIYHTNLGYKNVEHSGMFIGWVDKRKRKALMLSYQGQGKRKPARYKVYDISRTYNVMRPVFTVTDHFLFTDDEHKSVVIGNKKYDRSLNIQENFNLTTQKSKIERVKKIEQARSALPLNASIAIPLKASELDFEISAKSQSMAGFSHADTAPKSNLEPFKPSEELEPFWVQSKLTFANNSQPNLRDNNALSDFTVKNDAIAKVKVKNDAIAKVKVKNNVMPKFDLITDLRYPSNPEDNPSDFIRKYAYSEGVEYHEVPLLFYSEQYATQAVKKVLKQARKMTLENKSFKPKDPHYYMQSVFHKAEVKYDNIFNAKQAKKRSFNPDYVKSGDWIYYGASKGDKARTGIFVSWVDENENEGLVLSYSNSDRQKARYEVRKVQYIFDVKRPQIGNLDLYTRTR